MNRFFVALSFLFLGAVSYAECQEKNIVVLMAVHNDRWHLKQTLTSIFQQKYTNYTVLVTDRGSDDGSLSYIRDYAMSCECADRLVCCMSNKNDEGTLGSYTHAFKCLHADDIVVLLSPRDYLINDQVFSYLNYIYSNANTWMTYGPYFCIAEQQEVYTQMLPKKVMHLDAYREYLGIAPYLHSFQAGLLLQVKKDALCIDKKYIKTRYHRPLIFPMLEMAGKHLTYVSKALVARYTNDEYVGNLEDPGSEEYIDIKLRCCARYGALTNL